MEAKGFPFLDLLLNWLELEGTISSFWQIMNAQFWTLPTSLLATFSLILESWLWVTIQHLISIFTVFQARAYDFSTLLGSDWGEATILRFSLPYSGFFIVRWVQILALQRIGCFNRCIVGFFVNWLLFRIGHVLIRLSRLQPARLG